MNTYRTSSGAGSSTLVRIATEGTLWDALVFVVSFWIGPPAGAAIADRGNQPTPRLRASCQ